MDASAMECARAVLDAGPHLARGMDRRQPHATDRRRVTLAVTTVGRHALQVSHKAAQHYLATVGPRAEVLT